jgi:prepilin-type N-terminal cleavage/methylation domain-containing protein
MRWRSGFGGRNRLSSAFTLIELLAVIAIIALIAALAAPIFKQFSKSDVVEAATRQMLDDCARARQLAISQHSTVYMVFIPTNFWGKPANFNTGPWNNLPPAMQTSTIITQMYGAQWTGYMMTSLRTVGDQPGRQYPHDLVRVKTLPDGSFIAPFKFTAPLYPFVNAPYPTNRPDLPIYGFLLTNNIPFPTADVLTNAGPPNPNYFQTFKFQGGLTLPYVAFNYLGQLTPGDGSLLPYDENIPLAFGAVLPSRSSTNRMNIQGFPNATEMPAGNSTNISFNVIHIDRLTGRARVERQDVL